MLEAANDGMGETFGQLDEVLVTLGTRELETDRPG